MGGVYDGVQLGHLISDALKRSLPISHAVKDAAERPHVSFRADLHDNKASVLARLRLMKAVR